MNSRQYILSKYFKSGPAAGRLLLWPGSWTPDDYGSAIADRGHKTLKFLYVKFGGVVASLPFYRTVFTIIVTFSAGTLAAQSPQTMPPAPAQTGTPFSAVAPNASSNLPAVPAIATNTAPVPAGPSGRDGARLAQRLYVQGKYRESAEAYLQAREGAVTKLQNDCLFNAGCALYKAGQYQEAAARFAEVAARDQADVAGACHNLGCASFELAAVASRQTNGPPELRPRLLEQAGQAFQRALRANSDRADARASLAVVTDQLPDARETAKREALLSKYQQAQPFQITEEMLTAQRKLNAALPAALTNATPARISQFENLAELQRGNTDLLMPLQAKLGPLLAGQSNAPAVLQHLDAVKTVMQESRESLRSVDAAGYRSAHAAESGIYQFWKGLAPFASLLKEDIFRQTNAIVTTTMAQTQAVDTAEQPIDLDQKETVPLTQLFIERFSEAVPTGGTPSAVTATAAPQPAGQVNVPLVPAGTNATPAEGGISAATRTNILNLAHQAIQTQEQALKYLAATNLTAALPQQRVSYELLKEIEKLLPKDKNQDQQNQQNQPQSDQQQQDQQKQDQSKQDQPQPQNQPDQPKPDQQKPPESPPEQPPEQPQPAAQDQAQPKDKEMTPDQAKALLEKAKQREQEHQEEKMRREYLPPSPVEKDW